ncbi:MAG: hypothetical protein VKO64_11270 [Candidatus Sericytochromatia bacterium]|nr:hypothetical protein [Candidatus Sericytochromatia bacterium]
MTLQSVSSQVVRTTMSSVAMPADTFVQAFGVEDTPEQQALPAFRDEASVVPTGQGSGLSLDAPVPAAPAPKPEAASVVTDLLSRHPELPREVAGVNVGGVLNDVLSGKVSQEDALKNIFPLELRQIIERLLFALRQNPPDLAEAGKAVKALCDFAAKQEAVDDFLSGKSNSVPPEMMAELEQTFGDWKGFGRNVDPTKGTGPQGGARLRSAIEAYQKGDMEAAKASYASAQQTASPVALDLDGDGKIGTTGVSTAKNRIDGEVGKTVSFDIDGDGDKDQIEWMAGQDGLVVDDRDGGATAAAAGNGEIDGKRLFGDEGGKYGSGYDKMRSHDVDGDGRLTGKELEGLKTWVDADGDAKVDQGELKTMAELGITELSVQNHAETNARGETLDRSSMVRNGERQMTEDVWFAKQ